MQEQFQNRVDAIIDAVKKTSPGDSSLGIGRTAKGDGLDLLVDAIEDLLKRSRESMMDFQSAHDAALRLHITGEKVGEEELPPERILLMDALEENIPDNIYFKDRQSRFIHLSRAFLKAFNIKDPREAIGKTDFDYFTEEHAREAFEDEQRIMSTGEPIVDKEERETRPDRPDAWVLTTKMPLRDKRGNIVGTFGISRDITERKRAEAALRESEERYRQLVELSPDSVLVHREGKVAFVNSSAAALFGADTPGALVGKDVMDLVHPDFREIVQQRSRRIQRAGEYVPREEQKCLHLDGSAFDVEVSSAPIIYDGVRASLTMIRDITERKRAEEALRESQEKYRISESKYRNLIEVAPEGISVVDNAKVLFFNNHLLEMLGYSHEEMVGMEIARIIHKDDAGAAMERYAARTEGNLIPKATFRDVRKDGKVIWVETVGQMIEWDGRPAVLYFTSDVTEKKRLEERLAQAQKMEAIGQLAGGIAHDFNNVLQVIIGYCEVLNREPLPANRKYVAEITKAAQRAATLIEQLLAFSRKQVLRPHVIDTKDLLRSTQKMLERVIGEDIELRTFIDPSTGNFLADPGQMTQILLNLAVNARDAMPSGGKLTIETSNRTFDETYLRDHPGAKEGQYVRIAVSDTGIGMDQETLSRIYEPFFTTKEKGKGTGLGLSTVYGIVKQSEGYINCYSEVNRGTTFTLYLPLTGQEAGKALVSAPGTTAPRGTERILLVDDDSAVRSVARIALEKAGYVVIEASAGEEALAAVAARNTSVALLVADVVMPRMSGKELARRLRELSPKARVLYISGYTANVISHHGILEADLNFLQKPFSATELLTVVREILDKP